MRFPSWLRNRSARRTQPATRFRPQLESLDDRIVPSTLRVNHDANFHAAADATTAHGTLAWAVANAQNGDTILLTADAAQNGITLRGSELILTQQNLTIETEAGSAPAMISGGKLSRVFEVASGAQVTLDNVVITGGNGVANNSASSAPDGWGGGIVVDAGAMLTMSGSTVSGNSTGFGGGICNRGALTVSGSTLSGNSGQGGALYNDPNSTATITSSVISGNIGGLFAGGIDNEGTLTLNGSTVSGNAALSGGGIRNQGTMLVSDCTLTGNTAGLNGGAIWNGNGGMLTVSNSMLASNSAMEGGGLYNFGRMTVSDCTVSGNSASVAGGGIFTARYGTQAGTGALYVTDGSTVCGNSAPEGADVFSFGTVFISSDSDVCIISP